MDTFTDHQRLLTLSLIAYRGYLRKGGEGAADNAVTTQVVEGLASLAPVKGRYQLSWGPSTDRTSLSLLDDTMMFVVQDLEVPSRYVVVVRGTNPVSITDWIFGDIWADRTVPWPYGKPEGDARISLSTSLGLSTLQSLHAPVGPQAFGFETAVLTAGVNALLHPIDAAVAGPLRALRKEVHTLAEHVLTRSMVDSADAAIDVAERRSSEGWTSLKSRVAHAMDVAGSHVQFDLYRFLRRGNEMRARSSEGMDLATFLRTVTDDGPAEIWVTGHSKGAALAATLALWLADTQGTYLPEDRRWDPDRRAAVHCMTFAGPTAGNAAFAAHSDAVIGDRCHRVVNAHDLVTHGWIVEGLHGMPGLYGDALPAPRIVAELATAMAKEIEALNYTHVGRHVTTFEGKVQPGLSFLEQVAWQHLEAYVEHAGLSPHVTRKQILGF